MTALVDPIDALVSWLRLDSDLVALVGGRVYGGQVPQFENASMPRPLVTVNPAGGGFLGRSQDYGDRRIDVDCYGQTRPESWAVYLASRGRASSISNASSPTGCSWHWANEASRGTSGVEPDTDWPVTYSSWQLLASDVLAA
ncbi:MAG: hypothetical protein M5T61_21420 [Acidimicrobiia bacterium]|nr:hypothetical protein [Acidimicrobiia bacterium]